MTTLTVGYNFVKIFATSGWRIRSICYSRQQLSRDRTSSTRKRSGTDTAYCSDAPGRANPGGGAIRTWSTTTRMS